MSTVSSGFFGRLRSVHRDGVENVHSDSALPNVASTRW
jgi:hypothetical protein